VLSSDNGVETTRKVKYKVPTGAPTGTLYLTASDATSANLLEFQNAAATPFRSPAQLFSLLNGLRSNTNAYLRVWRAENSYTVEGRDFPDPPPSIGMILTRAQPAGTSSLSTRGSRVAEIEIPASDNVVTGSKTVQIEVRD